MTWGGQRRPSKWWFWGVMVLANLYLLLGYSLLMASGLFDTALGHTPHILDAAFDVFLKSAAVWEVLIYEPIRLVLELDPHVFYSLGMLVLVWELFAEMVGMATYGVAAVVLGLVGKPTNAKRRTRGSEARTVVAWMVLPVGVLVLVVACYALSKRREFLSETQQVIGTVVTTLRLTGRSPVFGGPTAEGPVSPRRQWQREGGMRSASKFQSSMTRRSPGRRFWIPGGTSGVVSSGWLPWAYVTPWFLLSL